MRSCRVSGDFIRQLYKANQSIRIKSSSLQMRVRYLIWDTYVNIKDVVDVAPHCGVDSGTPGTDLRHSMDFSPQEPGRTVIYM